MNCDTARELLPWLLNRSLDDAERRQLVAHLEDCDECRTELAELQLAARIYSAHLPTEEVVAHAYGQPTRLDPSLVALHLATCERCAEELALVEESHRLADDAAEPDDEPGRVVPFLPAETGRRLGGAWTALALAASLIAAVGLGGWMWSWQRAATLADRLEDQQHASAAAADELAALEGQVERLRADQRQAAETLTDLQARVPASAGSARSEAVFAAQLVPLSLHPEVLRGTSPGPGAARPGSVAAEVASTAEATALLLALGPDDVDGYRRFEVRILGPGGEQVGVRRDLTLDAFGNLTPAPAIRTARFAGSELTIEVYGVTGERRKRLGTVALRVAPEPGSGTGSSTGPGTGSGAGNVEPR